MKRRPKWRLKPIVYEPLPEVQSLLIPVAARVFEGLEVSASLKFDDGVWHAIHTSPGIGVFEGAHGVETARWAYNERCSKPKTGPRQVVLGQHAGFFDFFVPVKRSDVGATLVAGPFSRARATSTEVLERWRAITGTLGRVSDPGFSEYLAMTLSTLTLEGSLLEDFRRFLTLFSQLLEAKPDAKRLAAEITPLIDRLEDARHAERMWRAGLTMVDPRTSHGWASRARLKQLLSMGVKAVPEHVIVGLLVGSEAAVDPVEDIVRRDAFQRACVAFVRKRAGAVCLRLGDHGVALLVDDSGQGPRLEGRLTDLSRRVLAIARRFGLRLHAGVSAADDKRPLPARYQAALSAAERALYSGASVERASGAAPLQKPLSALRQRLIQAANETPDQISALFTRFAEAAAVHSMYVLDSTRAHLDAGFEQLADALRAGGNVDERTLSDLKLKLERNSAAANTIRELKSAYQPIISDLELALQRPVAAGQDRALQRAIGFIHEHLNEALPLAKVARVAGYAPRYFAKLFVRDERMTLSEYVTKLRLARSQELLKSTLLTIEQVQKLSGFRTRVHFHRAFKQAFGSTPGDFRSAGLS